MLCTGKHRRCDTTTTVRIIPETLKGLGLSQQSAFCPQKAMLAVIVSEIALDLSGDQNSVQETRSNVMVS